MPDPAPIRGRWTIWLNHESRAYEASSASPGPGWVAGEVVPVPDEAAIERAAKAALAEMERRDLWHTTPDGYDVGMNVDARDAAAVARAVLRAALGLGDT